MQTFKYVIFIISLMSFTNTAFASGSGGGSGGGAAAGAATASAGANRLKASSSEKVEDARKEIRERMLKRQQILKQSKSQQIEIDHFHSKFQKILSQHVKPLRDQVASQVDYENIPKQELDSYINDLLKVSEAQVLSMSKTQRYAFYFNLYNALTIQLVLSEYPNLQSIKDLGSGFPLFRSPWKKRFFRLFGKKTHLDEIEHSLVRGAADFDEPRVHFAVNCASIGCPALLNEAFVSHRLEDQLERATKNFLKDRTRNFITLDENKVSISPIFKWYGEDFKKGHQGIYSLRDFLAKYSESLADTSAERKLLLGKEYSIEFTDYDWRLNGTPPRVNSKM